MSQYTHPAGRRTRRILTGLSAVAIPAAFAVSATTPAYAATAAQVSVVGGTTMVYSGGVGNTNNVVVSRENGVLTVTDLASLAVGPGCQLVSRSKAQCGVAVTQVSMALGDQNDKVRVDVALSGFIDGQEGDDTFSVNYSGTGLSRLTYDGGAGSSDAMDYSFSPVGVVASLDDVANDTGVGHRDNVRPTVEHLVGSQSSDTLVGSGARNVIDGGQGNDTMLGLGDADKFLTSNRPDGADSISGGAGLDTISYQARGRAVSVSTDNLAGDGEPAERDNVGSDVESLIGTEFADTLFGGSLANTLHGRGGDDVIAGAAGPDLIFAGTGADRVSGGTGDDQLLLNRDGEQDVLDCGANSDTVNRESLDSPIGCEKQV
ncbi:MAG TPA: calcium-binding protein [Microlunatus sp.]